MDPCSGRTIRVKIGLYNTSIHFDALLIGLVELVELVDLLI
jgi:hypothetical protein